MDVNTKFEQNLLVQCEWNFFFKKVCNAEVGQLKTSVLCYIIDFFFPDQNLYANFWEFSPSL